MAAQPERESFIPRIVDDVDVEAGLAVDRKSVELRSAGKSYSAIARSLGLAGPRKAHEAFSRDLRRRPTAERETLRKAEAKRLDTLAKKTEARADLDAAQIAKRLRAIERLRQTVMMD